MIDPTGPEVRAALLAAFEAGYNVGVAVTQGMHWAPIEEDFDEYLQRTYGKGPS